MQVRLKKNRKRWAAAGLSTECMMMMIREHLSIHDLYSLFIRFVGKLEPIPADFEWEAGFIMVTEPQVTNLLQGEHEDKQPFTLTFTSVGRLEYPFEMIWTVFGP